MEITDLAVQTTQVGTETIQTTSARDLHEFLEVGRDFTNWIKFRINQYEFVEGEDFAVIKPESGPTFGKSSEDTVAKSGEPQNTGTAAIEYYVSMDMAKELSMVENNAKGREARKYFIAAEKEMKRLQKVNDVLQAENEALLKWNLTNCHGAITTLQDDNGVARRQVILPLQIERTKNERLTLQNARLDKQLELAKFHAANDDRDRVRKLERDVKMWRKGCAELEERMETLEQACGITRDTPIFRAWKFKLA